MKLTLSRLVWVLAAVLVAVIAVEAARRVAPRAAPVPANAAIRSAAPASAEPVAAWTSTILARPLFSPERRPSAPAAVAAAEPAAPQSLPRLAGIVVTPRSRTAIFSNGADHSTIATEGATVGEWRVVAIHAEAVELAGPDGARTVHPTYSSDPPPPQTALIAGFTPGMPFIPPAGNLLPTPPGGRPLNPGGILPGPPPSFNAPGAVPRNRP
jgi:general secretion pathway protein N